MSLSRKINVFQPDGRCRPTEITLSVYVHMGNEYFLCQNEWVGRTGYSSAEVTTFLQAKVRTEDTIDVVSIR